MQIREGEKGNVQDYEEKYATSHNEIEMKLDGR
jgi:hypothetical protein